MNNTFPILSTPRLILRRLALRDAPALYQLRSDDDVNKYLGRPKAKSVTEAEAFVQKIDQTLADNKGVYWVLALKEDDMLIGTICYWNFEPENRLAEIGYELSPAWQGKGLMQEALEKVIEYGFTALNLKVITALPVPENQRSVKILERNNFLLDTTNKYVSEADADGCAVYYLTAPVSDL